MPSRCLTPSDHGAKNSSIMGEGVISTGQEEGQGPGGGGFKLQKGYGPTILPIYLANFLKRNMLMGPQPSLIWGIPFFY